MEFTVSKEEQGMLLRSYLKRHRLSHKLVASLKAKDNGILVNGAKATVRAVLNEGDIVTLDLEDRESGESARPVDLPVEVLYEDDDLIVCSKPANMPTHPSCGHYDDTLANALAYYFAKRGQSFVFRPVNRLDRNTSGAVMIAKNVRAAAIMYSEMMNHRIHKSYVALTEGTFVGEGTIETFMCRTEKSIIVRRNCEKDDEGAQYALTEYKCLDSKDGITAVRLFPKTGRTHQLRVHLSGIGHPILGDDLYGKESELISHHALHAETLGFYRPCDGEYIMLNAPMPEDMRLVIEKFSLEFDK